MWLILFPSHIYVGGSIDGMVVMFIFIFFLFFLFLERALSVHLHPIHRPSHRLLRVHLLRRPGNEGADDR